MHFQGRKREAVLTEQQRRIKEAIIQIKVAAVPDDLELKAVKAMGAMEEGDAVFGAGAEVNLDSQVSHILLAIPKRCVVCYNLIHACLLLRTAGVLVA